MRLLDSQNRIIELFSRFVTQVKGAGALGRTDINKVSETILVPLLSEVYGYKGLRNLNTTERSNFPAIDLADDEARVAFQITSMTDLGKVKDTIEKFEKYELHEKYDKLFIYVLTEKQKIYSTNVRKTITQDGFNFDIGNHVLDYRDILRKLEGFQVDKTLRVQNILEGNLGVGSTPLSFKEYEQTTESVHLNLLELFFPATLCVADLAIDKESVPRTRKRYRGYYGQRTPRELVQDALEQAELRFGVDWECHQNQILTFHDLSDHNVPLAQLVDQGTVTPIDAGDFYGEDENQERVFKSLLGRCLQQKLYHQGVMWQFQEKEYIFSDEEGAATRIEKWQSKRENERVVFERVMKNNKPEETLHCKHFAFRTQFKIFGGKWYLLIEPDWFFSHDGYRQSHFGSERIDWLKKQENNSHVFNHVRFIVHFLKHDKPSGLFVERYPYPFLTFGELCSFNSAPALDDNTWNPPRTVEEKDSSQLDIFDL
ncbi:MAG: SMEK domain-containing protein [Caldilineaceae bacterium]|nr:SMEK domain-containing protein [Caldilineaceae bacterium]